MLQEKENPQEIEETARLLKHTFYKRILELQGGLRELRVTDRAKIYEIRK